MGASKLGQLLVEEGLLSEHDRRTIRSSSGPGGSAFAKGLITLGLLDEDELAAFIADRTHFRIVSKNILTEADDRAVGAVDTPLLERLEVLPLKLDGMILTVAMADPMDRDTIQQLEFFTGYHVKPVIATMTQIRAGLKRAIPHYQPKPSPFERFIQTHAPSATRRIRVSSASQRPAASAPRPNAGPAPSMSHSAMDDEVSSSEVSLDPISEDLSDDASLNFESEDLTPPASVEETPLPVAESMADESIFDKHLDAAEASPAESLDDDLGVPPEAVSPPSDSPAPAEIGADGILEEAGLASADAAATSASEVLGFLEEDEEKEKEPVNENATSAAESLADDLGAGPSADLDAAPVAAEEPLAAAIADEQPVVARATASPLSEEDQPQTNRADPITAGTADERLAEHATAELNRILMRLTMSTSAQDAASKAAAAFKNAGIGSGLVLLEHAAQKKATLAWTPEGEVNAADTTALAGALSPAARARLAADMMSPLGDSARELDLAVFRPWAKSGATLMATHVAHADGGTATFVGAFPNLIAGSEGVTSAAVAIVKILAQKAARADPS